MKKLMCLYISLDDNVVNKFTCSVLINLSYTKYTFSSQNIST